MFFNIPIAVWYIAIFGIGAIWGAAVNWTIYAHCYFKRPWSPWSRLPESMPRRNVIDRVPIVGWWFLRRYATDFEKPGYWIRPMLIELGMGLAMIGLFRWLAAGGILNCQFASVPLPTETEIMIWFVVYSAMLGLLAAATFIDLDEQNIPDAVTVTGTLFALGMAYAFPLMRLPAIAKSTTGPAVASRLLFTSPNESVDWPNGSEGLLTAIGIVVIWSLALLPFRTTWRRGWKAGIKYLIAHIIRPKRKTECAIRIKQRERYIQPYFYMSLAVILPVAVALVWRSGGERWESLFSQLMGLAFGGGLVWAVRIIGSVALGREAMGFGDVTLMAMIGAFLGWQSALLVFLLAPFSAIFVAVAQFVVTRRHDIAFGPYLCLSAVLLVINWGRIWHDWAQRSVFAMSDLLLTVLGVGLFLMASMLAGWAAISARWFPEEESESGERT